MARASITCHIVSPHGVAWNLKFGVGGASFLLNLPPNCNLPLHRPKTNHTPPHFPPTCPRTLYISTLSQAHTLLYAKPRPHTNCTPPFFSRTSNLPSPSAPQPPSLPPPSLPHQDLDNGVVAEPACAGAGPFGSRCVGSTRGPLMEKLAETGKGNDCNAE